MRTRLEEAKEAIRNQVKKETKISTMKWVFFLFRRITELVIETDGSKYRKVLNLDGETIKVLELMGEEYEKLYVKKMVRNVGSVFGWHTVCNKYVTFYIILCKHFN